MIRQRYFQSIWIKIKPTRKRITCTFITGISVRASLNLSEPKPPTHAYLSCVVSLFDLCQYITSFNKRMSRQLTLIFKEPTIHLTKYITGKNMEYLESTMEILRCNCLLKIEQNGSLQSTAEWEEKIKPLPYGIVLDKVTQVFSFKTYTKSSIAIDTANQTSTVKTLVYKRHQIQKLKCFSPALAVVFAQSIEARWSIKM